jgi:hypothetical protein
MKPATQFLELITTKPDVLFRKYIIREENRKSGIEPIMKYYQGCPADLGNGINIGLDGKTGASLFGEKTSSKSKKQVNRKRLEKRTKVSNKIFKN